MANDLFNSIKTKLVNSLLNSSTALLCILLLAVLSRVPAIFQELPPYLFCDEGLYADEAFVMLQQNRLVTHQFKAGGLNIYLPLFVAKIILLFDSNIFSYTNYGYTNFVILGRAIYLLVINPLTIVFIYFSAVELFRKKSIGLFAALAFLVSPLLLANSRMWYPDHYIGFFSAGLFYFLIKNYQAPEKIFNYLMVGVFLALTISTKYTGLLLVPVVGIILLINLFWRDASILPRPRFNLLVSVKLLFCVALSAAAILLIVNFSALVVKHLFIRDFNFNIENYGRHDALNWRGVGFYLFVLYYLSLGGFGLIAIALGYRDTYKKHPRLIALLLAPIAIATYLGVSGLVLFRNMTIFLPLIFLVAGVGIHRLCQLVLYGQGAQKTLAALVLIGIVFSQLPQVGLTIKRDFGIDSRVQAEAWIRKNIPSTSLVGTNDFCAGPSPAKLAGLQTEIDRQMSKNLDYYVFDTYWTSIFDPAYIRNKGILQEWDQKYLHYYFFSDVDIFRWKTSPVRVRQLVPPGYQLVKWFKSSGPDVLILKKE
jgi:4-amino-4-deoxy-L-arabinose transferase-like glycosyltransferase